MPYGVEYWVLKTFLTVAGPLPPRAHPWIAGALSAIVARLGLYPRGVLRRNFDIAFPGLEGAELRSLERATCRETALLALEFARLTRARPEEVLAGVEASPEALARLEAALAEGRGLLLSSGHFGNWEWMAAYYALRYGAFGVVYKPMHNALTDGVIERMRRRFGTQVFSTRERVGLALLRHLRDGGAAGIMGDQDARRQGIFVPFFGRPASTAPGLAALAVRLKMPILPCFCHRTGPCRFELRVEPALRPDPSATGGAARDAEIERLTQACAEALERAVRREPAQYFWWHRRWKTRPPLAG